MKKTYRWIYRNCGKELLWVILLGASSILMAGAFLGLAVAASYLLDVIIGSKEGHPYLWGGVVLGIILLLALLNILNTNIRARAGGRIEMRLRRNLFDQLLKKRYPQLKQIHSGEIINRMTSDVEILVNTLITLVPSALSMATKLGAGLALLFLMEWRFTLLILAAGVGVGLANRLFGKRFRHLHKEIQRTNGVVRSFLQECMENVIAIKSFSNESAIESKLDDYQQANYKIRLKRVRVLNLANTSVYVIFTVGYYAAMVWGGIGIAQGVFTFGALTAFLQIINQVKAPFRNISGLIPQYFSMTASAERLMELEELADEKKETEIPDVDGFYEGLESIAGEGLSFRYQDDEEDVLENTYNVILQQGEGYTLATTETTKVTAGETFSFSVAIAEGYHDTGFTVKAKMGEEKIPVSPNEFGYYTCTVNGDLIISVEGVKPITFQATVKEEGSINAVVAPVEGYEADSIAYNGTYQFTVTPKDHYKVTQVAVNGEVKEAVDGVYTVNGITKDLEISVETIQVVTVTFVDGKYNNSREVSYTIEDMQPEGFVTVLAAESGNPTLYAFGGWYDQEGNPVTRITPDDLAKQTITLTAQWVPVFGDILDLTTTGEEFFQDEGDRYVININTVISFSEDLSEEYNANVKITGYGTLYAPEWIDTTNQEIVNAILERDQTVKDGLITENKVAGLQLSNYFRNRDLTPEQVIGQTYGLSKNSSNPMHRYAAGWMELSVDGEKVIVFSNVCEITAPQA